MASPFDINSYMKAAMIRESSGNPAAHASTPGQSASGLYGFTNGTYLPLARQLNPGLDDQSLMSRKNDPNMQNKVMQAFTQQNVDFLNSNGLPVTNGSVYLSHFLGAGGAKNVLSAPDNTPISQVVSPEALAANKSIFGKAPTVGALKNWAEAVQGPTGSAPSSAMQTAMGSSTPPADAPAPGAQETSQQTGQAGFAVPDAPQSDMDKFLSGGPGALFGAPQQGWNMGDALTGAGVAMMARDNPSGAAALASALRYSQKGQQPTKQAVQYDKATGKAFVFNPQSGKIETQQVEDPATKPLAEGTRKAYQENQEKADTAAQVLDKMNFWRDKLASGDLDVTAVSKLGNNFRNLTGNSDPKTRMAAQFAADMEDMRNQRLLEAKGVQTEGDAQRAMNAIFPGTSGYDNKTTLGMLDRATTDLRNSHDRYAGYNLGISKNHADADPDGMWSKQVQDRQAGWNNWSQEYSQRRDKFLSQPDAVSAPGTQVTGQDPMKQKRSFKSFFNGG